MGRQWRPDSLPDSAWRPLPGLTRLARAEEQDSAAGGRDRRLVAGTSRPILASIYFRRKAGRRVYAYLRWSENGSTSEQFVCEVDRQTRTENLILGWSVATERRMLTADPTQRGIVARPSGQGSWAATETVRRQMQANRSRDTRPELALRSSLHELGLRYRVAARPVQEVRRTADVVFTKARVAVFLDGCFWHGCPEHHRPARRNEEFWREKIARNRERDAETDNLLVTHGWTVVRIWEHEDPSDAAERVRVVLVSKGNTGNRRPPTGTPSPANSVERRLSRQAR